MTSANQFPLCFAALLFVTSTPSRIGESLHLGKHHQQRVSSRNYNSIRWGCYLKNAPCFARPCCYLPMIISLSAHSQTCFFSIDPSSVFSELTFTKWNKINFPCTSVLCYFSGKNNKKKPFIFLVWRNTQISNEAAPLICFAYQFKWHTWNNEDEKYCCSSFLYSGVVGPELTSTNVSIFITSDAGNTWREVQYNNWL